jgi:hypothetical protein
MSELSTRVSAVANVGHGKFFRGRLLALAPEEIEKLLEQFDTEVRTISKEATDIAWYSRGSLMWSDAFALSPDQRKIWNDMIKDHLETTKKSGLPFF